MKNTISVNNNMLFIVCVIFAIASLFIDTANAGNRRTRDINAHIDRLLDNEHVKGEIIVKFRDTPAGKSSKVKEMRRMRIHSKIGAKIKKKYRRIKGLQLVEIPQNKSMRDALRSYLKNKQVQFAEPNYIVHASVSPDDPDFNKLWGLYNTGQSGGTAGADIGAPEAWNLTTGSDSVIIAVVDTGVAYNHTDLAGNIWINTGEDYPDCNDGVDNDLNGYKDDCYGWDFLSEDNDPTDYNGHGTHVSGTIAAVGNNSTGSTGVMWQAKIMPLRFLGIGGSGYISDAIDAIIYANENGAHVINNSWTGSGYSQALKSAIDASSAVVVCAAGNYSLNNDSYPYYPASYSSPNIISVAATDRNDNMASFSNYGATSVDVGAPGVSIYSTVPSLSYGPSVTLYSQDFDGPSNSLQLIGWDRGGINSTWAVTDETGVGGTDSLEDSPGGKYVNNTYSWAGYMTPIPSVKNNLYTLSFMWKGEMQSHSDYLDITYSSDGEDWNMADYRTGTTDGVFISEATHDLTLMAEMYDSFYFGFGITAGHSVTKEGVFIDDVTLKRSPISISGFSYNNKSGTSMAAPHVSGIAGLIKAYRPGLSNLEIRDAILNTVETIPALAGKVVTGGRVNAFEALKSVLIDSDGDGIPDDGDASGIAGNNPCADGITTGCDDNCVDSPNPDQGEMDDDGVGDVCDNCREVPNADQRDTNSYMDDNSFVAGEQHYGNLCDPDFNNDGLVSIIDYNEWRKHAGEDTTAESEDLDINNDGLVWLQDYNEWRRYYNKPPGPGVGDL